MDLTQEQVAAYFSVSRNTVANWEGGTVPEPVSVAIVNWERVLHQGDSLYGPLTLIYSDGPMYVRPEGPRGAPSMHQEAYLTNAAALARVIAVRMMGRLFNAFILDANSAPLWNVMELNQMMNDRNRDAPSPANLVRRVGEYCQQNASKFASGPGSVDREKRIKDIRDAAEHLLKLARRLSVGDLQQRGAVNQVLERLRELGMRPPDKEVTALASAFQVFDQRTAPPAVMDSVSADIRRVALKLASLQKNDSLYSVVDEELMQLCLRQPNFHGGEHGIREALTYELQQIEYGEAVTEILKRLNGID